MTFPAPSVPICRIRSKKGIGYFGSRSYFYILFIIKKETVAGLFLFSEDPQLPLLFFRLFGFCGFDAHDIVCV